MTKLAQALLSLTLHLSTIMTSILDNLLASVWNRTVNAMRPGLKSGLDLGFLVVDGKKSRKHFFVPHIKRAEHIAIIGKSGSGKSSEVKSFIYQDIRSRRGFAAIDLHDDLIPFVLSAIRQEELRSHEDLSHKTIIVDPSDAGNSVGLNVLEAEEGMNHFAKVAELVKLFETRWDISLGPPTAELFRNSLHVLSDNQLTLAELTPLLSNATYRSACMKRVKNAEVREFFEERFDRASDGMQATRRDPVLNKVSEFVTDIHFRHIVGQQKSSVSLVEAMDRGCFVLLRLSKGRLGPQALLLASLFLAQMKSAIFRRKTRKLFTLYLDEVQNLVSDASGLEMLLAEARKTAVGICTANQFLDQTPNVMRAALMAVSTHVYFQVSGSDAQQVSTSLDGGKNLAERLKNLPPRNCVVKTGHYPLRQVATQTLPKVDARYGDLVERCRRLWTRPRTEVEAAIQARKPKSDSLLKETLNDWE
ncbi:MAG: hypothetical protein H0X25_10425 [Acidobacteriales bacterium]|nr:hypothetical protein [Terriglobales bacterium]